MRPFGFAGDVKKALQGLAGAGVFSSESAYSILANDHRNSMIPKLGTSANGKLGTEVPGGVRSPKHGNVSYPRHKALSL